MHSSNQQHYLKENEDTLRILIRFHILEALEGDDAEVLLNYIEAEGSLAQSLQSAKLSMKMMILFFSLFLETQNQIFILLRRTELNFFIDLLRSYDSLALSIFELWVKRRISFKEIVDYICHMHYWDYTASHIKLTKETKLREEYHELLMRIKNFLPKIYYKCAQNVDY